MAQKYKITSTDKLFKQLLTDQRTEFTNAII